MYGGKAVQRSAEWWKGDGRHVRAGGRDPQRGNIVEWAETHAWHRDYKHAVWQRMRMNGEWLKENVCTERRTATELREAMNASDGSMPPRRCRPDGAMP